MKLPRIKLFFILVPSLMFLALLRVLFLRNILPSS